MISDFSGGPLTGVRIVDLTQIIAGPLATQLLAEQGAEVIKVESLTGDLMRVGRTAGFSANYANNNRGKRSVAIDIATEAGRGVVVDLVGGADVFIENFRPGVCDRLGLGDADLRRSSPDLIYVSINGFGSSGPYADRPALDPVIQAYTGMVTGQVSDDLPFPDFVRTMVADKTTAYTAAQAITAALLARDRGAGGQRIEVPMLDSTLAWFWVDGMTDLTEPDDPLSRVRIADGYRLTETADGRIVYYTATDGQLTGLLRALDRSDLADDPRCNNLKSLARSPDQLLAVGQAIATGFAGLTTAEAVDRLAGESVPCGPILERADVADDPQIRHNECLVDWTHPVVGKLRQPAPPVRFGSTPTRMRLQIDELGEHTVEVLAELGRDAADIESLRDAGVIPS